MLSPRTGDYQNWVEAFARNHHTPIQWAKKGVRKEDYVLPWLRRMVKQGACGVYFIFKCMEQGPSFRIQETRVIRLLEVLRHAGNDLGAWTAKQIHETVLTTFRLSANA